MQKYKQRRGKPGPRKSKVNLILNRQASGYSEADVEHVKKTIVDSGLEYFIIDTDNIKELIFRVKKSLQHKPYGMIVCGGDGTVNLVARHLIRRTCPLGIIPMGKFNNIYRSLYGPPDLEQAIRQILSGKNHRIDQGLAGGYFFLGSVGLGLLPAMRNTLENRKIPRFGIGWSRLAASCSAGVEIDQYSIKIDSFGFEISPIMFNVNLLSHSAGLPISYNGIYNDGKAEVIFDIGVGKAIFSSYARNIFKGKYIYSDDIRMYRGTKIAIGPVENRSMYVDGEIHKVKNPELHVEVFPKRIRVFNRWEE